MKTAIYVNALALLGLLTLPSSALAKRAPAPVIEPVVHAGIRYRVPNDNGTNGYVLAQDAASGKQLWKKTLYVIQLNPLLEQDVQWVFIKRMRLDGNRLILADERNQGYSLDLKTRKVEKLKKEPKEKE